MGRTFSDFESDLHFTVLGKAGTVPEALEGLRELAKAASGGKVVPNFIVRGESDMPQRINLNLKNIPLTDAIKYVAGVSKTVCRYEANAVVFSGS